MGPKSDDDAVGEDGEEALGISSPSGEEETVETAEYWENPRVCK